MVSIHTNLSSIITQRSMLNSTNRLNLAVERLTTGYKINHASDNAANYSIATDMTTKINSYMVAEDNVAMGMDYVGTATSMLDLIGDRLNRLRALCTQTTNGSYGTDSIDAIKSEAQAHLSEINRIVANTEYNGIKLFKTSSGFLNVVNEDTPDIVVNAAEDLADAIANNSIIGISDANVLAELATLVNSGTTCAGKTIVLTDDIDLSAYQSGEGWTPIGNDANHFEGDFNGNGHTVENLKINRSSADYQGLFGYADGNIKNLGAEVNITAGSGTGAIAGAVYGDVTNCYSIGTVIGADAVGGLIGANYLGHRESDGYGIDYCYSECTVSGNSDVGGLVAQTKGTIAHSYATGNVTGSGDFCGGLVGVLIEGLISDSYATGAVTGGNCVGGLIGWAGGTIRHCYATGSVEGIKWGGGLVGQLGFFDESISGYIYNSYATGNVTLTGEGQQAGGLVGGAGYNSIISGCQAYGNISAVESVGGLLGSIQDDSNVTVTNCYTEGNINANQNCGGVVGFVGRSASGTIESCYLKGNVVANSYGGGILGGVNNNVAHVYITDSYTSCNITVSSHGGSVYGDNTGRVTINNSGGSGTVKVGGNVITDAYSMDTVPMPTYTKPTHSESDNFTFEKIIQATMKIGLQIGIGSDNSSAIKTSVAFGVPDLNYIANNISNANTLSKLDFYINSVSSCQTGLGAVQNRLESALEQINVSYDNLVSSRSTIQDADIAQVSSDYIRQQILQQAAATLMSTANQSPSIALQLI